MAEGMTAEMRRAAAVSGENRGHRRGVGCLVFVRIQVPAKIKTETDMETQTEMARGSIMPPVLRLLQMCSAVGESHPRRKSQPRSNTGRRRRPNRKGCSSERGEEISRRRWLESRPRWTRRMNTTMREDLAPGIPGVSALAALALAADAEVATTTTTMHPRTLGIRRRIGDGPGIVSGSGAPTGRAGIKSGSDMIGKRNAVERRLDKGRHKNVKNEIEKPWRASNARGAPTNRRRRDARGRRKSRATALSPLNRPPSSA